MIVYLLNTTQHADMTGMFYNGLLAIE